MSPRTASTLQHLLEEELWNPPTAIASTLQHLLEEELHGGLVDWGAVVGSHLIDGDVLDALALPQLRHVGDVVRAGLRGKACPLFDTVVPVLMEKYVSSSS